MVLILFLVYLAQLHPTNWFGRYNDNASYFSSAKSLAEGRGYVVPSLPGTPRQTKYPVLYPLLLASAWKIDAAFPSNLPFAIGLTAFFSCWFLVASFELLRKLKGVGDWPALVIVALTAFEPHYVLFSGSILSDLPFMALAITAAIVADRALRRDAPPALAGLAGMLAGLSFMMRSIAEAVIAGIFLAAIFRRCFRQAVALCLGTAPFVVLSLWFSRPQTPTDPRLAAINLPGWRQTLAYDTSYLNMWRISVPNFHVFCLLLRNNLQAAFLGPGSYLVAPTLSIGIGLAVNGIGAVIGFLTIAGILRQARSQEWKPFHFIFVCYVAVVLVWNYPLMDRFLLLLLPFFLMGIGVETRYLIRVATATLRPGSPATERMIAVLLVSVMAGFAGIAARNLVDGFRPQLRSLAVQHAELVKQRTPVYEWIRGQTTPESVIVAPEDTLLYLYADRQSVVPIALSTEWVYTGDRTSLERDLRHITDTAVATGACYWLVSPNDSDKLDFPTSEASDRIAELTSGLPEVSSSADRTVRLYDISSLSHQSEAVCAPRPAASN